MSMVAAPGYCSVVHLNAILYDKTETVSADSYQIKSYGQTPIGKQHHRCSDAFLFVEKRRLAV